MVYDAFGKLVAEYGVASEGVGGVKYVQQDWQGSVRAVTNSNGFVVARTDHQAFGNDVGYGVGQRSVEQGYSIGKVARQGYGLTERDDATGLDHTWFRKNENQAGRWTSPDPYNGSMNLGDPQSFNRYSYVGSDPTNLVDPSGLLYAFCDASMSFETCNALNAFLNGQSFGGILSITGVYHWNGDGYSLVSTNINFTPTFNGFGGPREPSVRGGGGGLQLPTESQSDLEECVAAARTAYDERMAKAKEKYNNHNMNVSFGEGAVIVTGLLGGLIVRHPGGAALGGALGYAGSKLGKQIDRSIPYFFSKYFDDQHVGAVRRCNQWYGRRGR
jgi:RHS repeat-associated protein